MVVPRDPGTPKTLYKYRHFDPGAYQIRLIEHGELWFSSARAFNDPFDSVVTYETRGTSSKVKRRWAETLLKREYSGLNRSDRRRLARERLRDISRDPNHWSWFEEKYIESVYDTLGICCLSSVRDDLLMWAHYSDSHRGFCVGLDTERVRELRERIFQDGGMLMLEKVRYASEMPRVNFYESMLDREEYEDTLTLFLTKSDHWRYEDEYRLIYWKHPDVPVELPPGTVTEVILGCRIGDEDRKRVIRGVRANWPDAHVTQAEKHDRRFGLTFSEL